MTVTVGVAGDTVLEAHETFTVRLGAATGTVVLDDTGRGTIRNDD